MSNIFPAVRKITPSYTIPETVIQYNQHSGYQNILASQAPMIRLNPEDRAVYAKFLDIRGRVTTAQSASNMIGTPKLMPTLKQTPTFLMRCRAEYDHHDAGAAGEWGVPITQAYSLAMQQLHFQKMREYCLFGARPDRGEGIVNAVGVTRQNLTADSKSNATVVTYDAGEMARFLLSTIVDARSRTMQWGRPGRIAILGPQRVIARWEASAIVSLAVYQQPGGGTNTTAGTVGQILAQAGVEIEWGYDDTLEGQGTNGSDAIIITIPEVTKPATNGQSTNIFAELAPGTDACNVQFTDVVLPIEITCPLPGGGTDVTSEMKVTSGWTLRPEATTILSVQFS